MKKYFDISEVKNAARGSWETVFSKLGFDVSTLTGRHTKCPGCGGNDRFRYDDRGGDGTWLCSGGGNMQSGDGIGLIMHVRECSWQEAIQAAGEALGLDGKEYKEKSSEQGVAKRPEAKYAPVNELYDHELLRKVTRGVEQVSAEWFIERSPVDPRRLTSAEFLSVIFQPGERALIFTKFYSQGDFAWEVGKGGFRLGEHRGVQAVKSALPVDGGKEGIWYLSNPVSLKWQVNPRNAGEYSRRTKECITSWRYLVLECDESKTLKKRAAALRSAKRESLDPKAAEAAFLKLGKEWSKLMARKPEQWEALANQYEEWAQEVPGLWFKFLAVMPSQIRAIYSSGGESWHALIYVGMETWADMDGFLKGSPNDKSDAGRLGAKRAFSRFGADPGALTPVRLTRLPGCLRGGSEQRLIYLNDAPEAKIQIGEQLVQKRILDLVPRRRVS